MVEDRENFDLEFKLEIDEVNVESDRYDSFVKDWINFGKLSENQQKSLYLFLQGMPISQVASHCNVHRSTVFRWMQQSNYRNCLEDWRRAVAKVTKSKLDELFDATVDRLIHIVQNPKKYESETLNRSLNLVFNARYCRK